MKTLLLAVVIIMGAMYAHAAPPFDASETLRKARVGIHSDTFQNRQDVKVRKNGNTRGHEALGFRYFSPKIRCYRDLSKPLTKEVICEERK